MSHTHDMLIELLREVNRGLAEQIKKILTEHQLPLTTIMITGQVKRKPGVTVSELARRTGFAKSHISKAVKELAKKGWIQKKTDPADQRRVRLFLSEDAEDQLAQVRERIRQQIAEVVSHLSEDKAAAMIEGLKEIRAALEITEQGKDDR
ncbi:MarR family winged helix-turn-helix transcriptional regulator [Calderihabitans maritimus]|uniref:Transcriptional regulator n=1 Tax=Calderihabitans maritimus TaxID=1246530 RepID=A0A1Z5HPD9_9FIRM|nr:MarR family transcriptional regulator [Calderihabitans maritimus]GAW91389.1 transcriptional regulator [Calderihabitans maritimus]